VHAFLMRTTFSAHLIFPSCINLLTPGEDQKL
jgi:hypothetical protein